MQLVTRLVTEGDLPVFVELYSSYREALVNERGGAVHLLKEAFAEPLETQFTAMLHDSESLLLFGLLEEVPVGVAVARLEETSDSSLQATIEVLFVDPPAREVGVGEKLVEAVVDWARRRGATGLDVWVLPGVREAKNFLEGSGFVARLLVMHRQLG
ncbi:MAG: GNAT family N-acetyltransferase [Acidimicrobiales bacterium]|jgi:GNAT superfamily N-acetyltransferase